MIAEATRTSASVGRSRPRLAPPRPVRPTVAEFRQAATDCGISLMSWQEIAATYIEARTAAERWLYPEVAVIVARQNGKTQLLVPHIVRRLRMGRRIMHTAQNRELPREVFGRVADVMQDKFAGELRRKPRFGSGQETIEMRNGGAYRIVAPSRGGARGPSNDDVIIDELREMVDHDFIAAAEPTLSQSSNPQILYLSNAGEDSSTVLNAIRNRADADANLAYLEWSAAPERDISDRKGWHEANPAIGQLEGRDMLAYLERKFESYRLAGTLSIFETEHLCRWVPTTRERMVDEFAWMACRKPLGTPSQPFMAVSTTPDGTRAAAVIAWQLADGSVALRELHEVKGSPIDLKAFADDINADAKRYHVTKIAHDPLTDAEIAKHLRKPVKITGQEFANASAQFLNLIRAGRLRWNDSDAITDDLAWTARKDHDDTGHFQAVRMSDDRPIPASLAAIRAVWLASGPPPPSPRIY